MGEGTSPKSGFLPYTCLPKWTRAGHNGLKITYIHPFEHLEWSSIIFGETCFWPIVGLPKWAIFKAV